jgi:hypothetical protein
MARVAQYGGETNLATDGVEAIISVGGSIVTTPTLGSRYAWAFISDGLNAPYGRFAHANSAANKIYYKFDFRITAAAVYLCRIAFSTTVRGSIQFTGGALRIYNSVGTGLGATSVSVSLDTWHTLQCMYDSTAGTLEFHLDGTYIDSQIVNAGGLNADNIYLGQFNNTVSTYYYDNILINDTTGSSQTGYPNKNERLLYFRPISEPITPTGTNKRWKQGVAGDAGDDTNYSFVDEDPIAATPYLKCNNADVKYKDWYEPETIAGIGHITAADTLTVVAVGGYVRGTGTTSRTFYYAITADNTEANQVLSALLEMNSNVEEMYYVASPLGMSPLITYPSNKRGVDLVNYAFGMESEDATTREKRMCDIWMEVASIPFLPQRNLAIAGRQAMPRANLY